MIDFPAATAVDRRIPKEAFYKRLPLTKALKERFVSDVERIVVENCLTKESLNLTADSEIGEILLVSIALKKKAFDAKIIEAIAKQNPHKLVFLLTFGNSGQLALYHGKLYRAEWAPLEELSLSAKGHSLSEIWDGLIEQIALTGEVAGAGRSIDERLALRERIIKLEKLIQKTEAAAWKEQQPKKRFELYSKMQGYKKELEQLKCAKR
ncbi:MAG: DUF4391 domain-containing protein [Oscillibacter sp.]|nr:DUF4391 domain-containing protein [Oscillibacter sp.]